MPHGVGWISALTALPLVGAALVLLLARVGRSVARFTAVVFAAAALLFTLALWVCFQRGTPGMQFEEWHTWAPSLGLEYHVGIDGLGLLMLAITSIVVLMSLIASGLASSPASSSTSSQAGRSRESRSPVYFALVLCLECGLFGVFTALNFLHWFLYWELSLVPAFFLIRLWGGTGRARAATQFFIYAMVGSIPLLLAFLAIYLSTGSFDFIELSRMAQDGRLASAIGQHLHWQHWESGRVTMLLFWGAFFGFAVKTPVVPFHGWLPAAYSEAPSEITMVLTGALSKMGIYGFLRILLPIFSAQMRRESQILLWLAVASIVLPALSAWAETDLKRMFAYSSINHLGYCILGVVAVTRGGTDLASASNRAAALTGVMLQVFSHAIVAATLFWFVALLERRSGGLHGLDDFGGLRKAAPVFAGMMGIAIFASLGLPGLIGFPAEFLIFKGAFPLASWATALSLLGLLVTAIFLLSMIQRVFSGPLPERWTSFRDLTVAERAMLAPTTILIFVVGLYPQMIAGPLEATVLQLVAQVRL